MLFFLVFRHTSLIAALQIPQNHLMIVAGGVTVQAGVVTDVFFLFPDFFLRGVDLLVDGFQLGGI